MMKKLAVTVFVLSLAAVGCGSDSGDSGKTDSGLKLDATTQTDGPAAKLDVAPTTDAPMKMDAAPDVANKVDQQEMDGGVVDGGMVDGGEEMDGGMIDGGAQDAPIEIDGGMGMMDAESMDTGSVDMSSNG